MKGKHTTNKLSFSLLTKILVISGAITVLLTFTQLFFTYKERIEVIHHFLLELETAHSPSITHNLVEFNYSGVQKIVDGILTYDVVSYVLVRNEPPEKFEDISAGTNAFAPGSVGITFPIIYDDQGVNTKLAMVEIHSDAEYLYTQLKSSFYVILVTQAIKTFLVSIMLLALFHRLIIRRIDIIHQWLLSYSPEKEFKAMVFSSPKKKLDELDELKNEINTVGESLHKHTQKLESLVRQRTIELEEATTKLEKLANTDYLTGIDNRMAFLSKSEKELNRSRRLSYNVGVMMIDIDHFKQINDNYGHEAGDKVLQLISNTVSGCLREEDSFGRLGGEEFAITVPGADKIGMQKLAARIQDAISLIDFSSLHNDRKVTVSIGYTKVANGELLKMALNRADKHLYSAKANGRNCYVTDKEFIPQLFK